MEQFLANVFANLVAGIILTLITHRRGEKKEFPAITDEDINNKTLGFNHRPRKCLVF